MLRVHPLEMNGHVGPAALGQRPSGSPLLYVDQLSQRMTAEVSKLLYVLKRGRNGDIRRALINRNEGDRLVGGTFHEELYLRVLVCCAERRERSRSDRCPVGALFTQTLRP